MAAQSSIEESHNSPTYSVFNVLDEIATGSTTIKLNTPPATQTQYDASIQTLQNTLHSLAGKQQRNQLPFLPVHEKAAVDVSPPRLRALVRSKTTKALRSKSSPRPTAAPASVPKQHIRQPSLGAPFRVSPFLQAEPFSDSQTHRLSVKKSSSRPASMHSISTARRKSLELRPTTSESFDDKDRRRAGSVKYDNQRCSPPAIRCSSSDTFQRTPSQRRPFKAIASLKNLVAHNRAEKRRKISKEVSTTPIDTDKENQDVDAPRTKAVLAPENVPRDHSWTPEQDAVNVRPAEVVEQPDHIMSPRWDAADQVNDDARTEMYHPLLNQSQSYSQRPGHAHRVSEAMSVSSSILDLAWPEPSSYYDIPCRQEKDRPRPDSSLEGIIDPMETVAIPSIRATRYPGASRNLRVRSSRLPPSPPPTCPLPACPQVTSTTSSPSVPIVSKNTSARLKSIAAKKGLVVDSQSAQRISVCLKDRNDRPADVPTSPLKLRSSMSRRNTRIESLRRQHLSLLIKDAHYDGRDDDFLLDDFEFPRRGSAPTIVQTTTSADSTMPAMKPYPSVDKPLPAPPSSAERRHKPRGSGSTAGKRTKSRRAQKSVLQSRRISLSSSNSIKSAKPLETVDSSVDASIYQNETRSTMSFQDVSLPGSPTFSISHSRSSSDESQPSTATSFSSALQNYDTDITSPPSSVTSSFGALSIVRMAPREDAFEVQHIVEPMPVLASPFDETRIDPFLRSHPSSKIKARAAKDVSQPSTSGTESEPRPVIKVNMPRTIGSREPDLAAVDTKTSFEAGILDRELERMSSIYKNVTISGQDKPMSNAECRAEPSARQSLTPTAKTLLHQQSEGQLRTKKTREVLAKIQDDFTTAPRAPQETNSHRSSIDTITQKSPSTKSGIIPRGSYSTMTDILNICARPAFRNRLDSQRCELVPRKPGTRPGTATTMKSSKSTNDRKFSLFPPPLPPTPKSKYSVRVAQPLRARDNDSAPSPSIPSQISYVDSKKRYSLISSFNPAYASAAGSASTHNQYHDYTINPYHPTPEDTEEEDEDEVIDLTKFLAGTREMDRAIERNLAW